MQQMTHAEWEAEHARARELGIDQLNSTLSEEFLAALSEDGVNPNTLTAEQFSAMNRMFRLGVRTGVRIAERTVELLRG